MTSSYNPLTDQLFVHDVGYYHREEINLIKKGANYGWPNFEGTYIGSIRGGNIATITQPYYSYMNFSSMTVKTKPTSLTKTHKPTIASNSDMGCAVLGGTWFSPSGAVDNALAEYTGDYLFVDLCAGWVSAIDFQTKTVKHLADNLPFQLMNVEYDNKGRVFLLTHGDTPADNTIQVIETQNPSPPVVVSAGGLSQIPANESTTLTPKLSGTDPMTFQWFFNGSAIDGQTTASLVIPQVSTTIGSGEYFLRVMNDFGQVDTPVWNVQPTARSRPTITLTVSKDGQSVKAGDLISFSAKASDSVDGNLAGSQFQWQVELRHNTHGHPLLDLLNTASGQFRVGDYSYEKGTLFIQLTLTVTNSAGLTQTVRKSWPVVFK